MDDDIIASFVIFAVIMLVIVLALNSFTSSSQPQLPSPQVIALMNNDTSHKQIITMPAIVDGVISDSSSPSILFYAYNPLEINQKVNVTWWVVLQLDKSYIIATLNGTPLNDNSTETFVLPANQTKECLLSFSMNSAAPLAVKEQFKNAGNEIIHFDMKSELMK